MSNDFFLLFQYICKIFLQNFNEFFLMIGRPARFHGSADSGLSDFSGSSGTGSSATVSRSAGEEVS